MQPTNLNDTSKDVCPFLVPRIRANGNEWGGEDTALLKTNFTLPLR